MIEVWILRAASGLGNGGSWHLYSSVPEEPSAGYSGFRPEAKTGFGSVRVPRRIGDTALADQRLSFDKEASAMSCRSKKAVRIAENLAVGSEAVCPLEIVDVKPFRPPQSESGFLESFAGVMSSSVSGRAL